MKKMNVDKFVNNRVLEKFSSIINLVTMKKKYDALCQIN